MHIVGDSLGVVVARNLRGGRQGKGKDKDVHSRRTGLSKGHAKPAHIDVSNIVTVKHLCGRAPYRQGEASASVMVPPITVLMLLSMYTHPSAGRR